MDSRQTGLFALTGLNWGQGFWELFGVGYYWILTCFRVVYSGFCLPKELSQADREHARDFSEAKFKHGEF